MKILATIQRLICAIFFTAIASPIVAEERMYGSFVYYSDIPNALFCMDAIKGGDDFELRKALRNHEIDTIVLASPGGNVWAGLSMAGIIFDKKLRVFVPPKAVCASACSFMFFGGNERLSEGELGVHQFSSSDETQTANAVKTQAQSQFTVSEIIGFLNEFDTPRFVLERMFEDREMYWFNSEETSLLNSAEFMLESTIQSAVSRYTSAKLDEAAVEDAQRPKYSEKELIALIQKRLNEIGCSAGVADGVWGAKTNAAAVKFAKKVGLYTSEQDLTSEAFFDALANAKKGFCPPPRLASVSSFAKRYYTWCDGVKTSGVMEVTGHDKVAKKVYIRVTNSTGVLDEVMGYRGTKFTLEGVGPLDGRFFVNNNGYVYKVVFSNDHCNEVVLSPKS